LKNKRIVETCQKNKINAVGLTGIDGNLIQGKRNLGIKVREKNKVLLKKDLSGKPKNINIGLIQLLMDNDYVPVITVPILDQNNIAINSENDDIVALISYQLKVSRVISLIEAPGLLEDASNENSLLKNLTKNQLTSRIEKSKGRIKRKLYSINKLFQQEIMKVHISDGRIENPIVTALEGGGTLIE
jgi:[amino group carrier protein]-L-2-aminoadipate 6-kinase